MKAAAHAKQPSPRENRSEMRVRVLTLRFQSMGPGIKTAKHRSVRMLSVTLVYERPLSVDWGQQFGVTVGSQRVRMSVHWKITVCCDERTRQSSQDFPGLPGRLTKKQAMV